MHDLNRREFTKRTTQVGSLLTGSLLGLGHVAGQDDDGADLHLVRLGLNALARAHEMDYFTDGHRGAAFVAAHLLCRENNLDEEARSRVVELFELNWASTPLCQPFPNTEPNVDQVAEIGVALAEGGEVLRQVGHNAIFAMLAIKAFRMLPSAATPERIEGVCKLVRSMTPWRDVEPDATVEPPLFSDTSAASKFILREAMDAIDRFEGYGQGFAGHMLTFGQSLVELAAMGDVEWAESCRTAFRKYVTVTRHGPEPDSRRIPDHKQSSLRPTQSAYWNKRGDHAVGIGHVFKYPYSYYDLLREAHDPELQSAFEKKVYAIF